MPRWVGVGGIFLARWKDLPVDLTPRQRQVYSMPNADGVAKDALPQAHRTTIHYSPFAISHIIQIVPFMLDMGAQAWYIGWK